MKYSFLKFIQGTPYMKFISISFVAIIATIFFMNSGYGMGTCFLFKCDDELNDCKLKECGSIIGLKKYKKCIKTKCKFAYDDCMNNCKDDDQEEDKYGAF